MKYTNFTRLASFGLRGLTLVGKFALIFVLVKFLEPKDVGLYGLITAAIAYAVMIIGFDFYTYSTRELINSDKNKWCTLLRDQGVFYIITYVAIIPFIFILFWHEYLPWELSVWFFPLLVIEHVAQEFNRLLVALSEPLWASGVLFLRNGLSSIVAAVLMWAWPEVRSLDFVFLSWIVGGLLACSLAALQLKDLDWATRGRVIDWIWIRRGVRVALPFLLATLSLCALSTVDRYWIDSLSGLDVLAAYVLFAGIASVIITILDATVFSFIYPSLIAAVEKGDLILFRVLINKLEKQTFIITFIISILIFLSARLFVSWLNKSIYDEYFHLLYWTVFSAAIFTIGLIPHYCLYAQKKDLPIIGSHLLALPIFAISSYTLNHVLAEASVPAGMAVAFVFLLTYKYFYLQWCTPFNFSK